jgi:hypothetical protein
MDKNEVYSYVEMTLRYICMRVGVPESEVIVNSELVAGIERTNPEIHSLVMEFLDAYWEWFQFSNMIIEQGKGGNLNAAEFYKLDALMKKRDETRMKLAEKVKSLPNR